MDEPERTYGVRLVFPGSSGKGERLKNKDHDERGGKRKGGNRGRGNEKNVLQGGSNHQAAVRDGSITLSRTGCFFNQRPAKATKGVERKASHCATPAAFGVFENLN